MRNDFMPTAPLACSQSRITRLNESPECMGNSLPYSCHLCHSFHSCLRPAHAFVEAIFRHAEFWCDRDTDPSPAPGVVGAVIALQIVVGSREYDPELDVNSDGRVTSLDALMILQSAAV